VAGLQAGSNIKCDNEVLQFRGIFHIVANWFGKSRTSSLLAEKHRINYRVIAVAFGFGTCLMSPFAAPRGLDLSFAYPYICLSEYENQSCESS
jgi:hypothetical protein